MPARLSRGKDSMARDRGVQLLSALGGASTARVLNLHQLGLDNAHNPEHWDKPLFMYPALNNAFLFKHSLKSAEKYMFNSTRSVVTKLVIPVDTKDLRVGGQAIFVDQRGYTETLRAKGNYSSENFERDNYVLQLVNAMPSLDPFLLRDQLLGHKIVVSPSYFAIAPVDQDRMLQFVSAELMKLASSGAASRADSPHMRLASAILSSEINETLDPLRAILDLTGKDFHDGIFSWRGFLYYKWSMNNFWPDVVHVLRQVQEIQPSGSQTPERRLFLTGIRRTIVESVRDAGHKINKTLSNYEHAFMELVHSQSAKSFRDFLLSAPLIFLELGEQLGVISHIVSFWRYRFPPGSQHCIDAEDLAAILLDFATGFGERMQPQTGIIKQPVVINGMRE